MSVRRVIGAAVGATLLIASSASAHVTLNPPEWEAEGFARFALRVPNERDKAVTTKITVKFPEEVLSASFQPIDGWKRTVKMAKLDEPIDDEGEKITERIDTVTWSGGRIRPGEFEEFGVSFQVPAKPGTELAFPSVQTYSNEVVRWIGPADSEEPAPRLTILEPAPEEGEAAPAGTPEATPAQGGTTTAESGDDGGDTLSIIAIVLAGLALATGVAALMRGRRATPQGAVRT